MDLRKIQKTGKMFYVYLPTNWCKKHNISSDTNVTVAEEAGGALNIFPRILQRKRTEINLTVKENNPKILEKLIMGCYVNPVNSFKITLEKGLTFRDLMNQNLMNIELIEIKDREISCESSISIENPRETLLIMIKRIKTLVHIMINNYNLDIINRYEEEIDRSKNLIEKSIISSLTMSSTSKYKPITLHYISIINRSLERLADHLIKLKEDEKEFIEQFVVPLEILKNIMEKREGERFCIDYNDSMKFVKEVEKIKVDDPKDLYDYSKHRSKNILLGVSEVLINWAITEEVGAN